MKLKLKREECRHTKHDSAFSAWKVLIGPSDWVDYLSGKDGATRYRIHNLPPNCSCPGLYELGVALTLGVGDSKTRKHDMDKIVVVYLGQADNVRVRLQEYGRAGSHLDHKNSSTRSNTKESPLHPKGPNLFKDAFSKGYSIVYRWSPMKDKQEAEKMETQLLQLFDYAWNRRLNSVIRHKEILQKLENAPTRSPVSVIRMFNKWKQPLFGKTPGIKINDDFPLDNEKQVNKTPLLPQIFKFTKSRPTLIQNDGWRDSDRNVLCGVAVGGGRVCRNKPVNGRKRCIVHKGRRITGLNSVRIVKIASKEDDYDYTGLPCSFSGIVSNDSEQKLLPGCQFPSEGNLSPKVIVPICKSKPDGGTNGYDAKHEICGVILDDGLTCMERPVSGRKRCEQHKGKRTTGNRKTTTKECVLICKSESDDRINGYDGKYEICGVVLAVGLTCMERPVLGRKRCEQHKGQRKIGSRKATTNESSTGSVFSACGIRLDDDLRKKEVCVA